MYTITFYSFKGGVGRTMALVNVAAQLAKMGRKVLMVDFDLEAPGLETFERLRPPQPHPGLVEYVTEYVRTKYSPDVREYIYSAGTIGNKDGQLWVMPAGRRDSDYQRKLSRFDWKKLYDDCDGFLFFEDLKAQWEQLEFKPDYVLIDSRTGDTDVKGICTRQLPDAVVMLFFPSEQNLVGLRAVCREIRRERAEGLRKYIPLHFVMSNVPDWDDEDRLLRRRLEAFRKELCFHKLNATLHRNENLQMIDQPIFVLQRPRTRLAAEYRFLARVLQIENPEDREGALLFLNEVQKEQSKLIDLSDSNSKWGEVRGLRFKKQISGHQPQNEDSSRQQQWRDPIENHVNQITDTFWGDAEILFQVGKYLLRRNKPETALIRFDRALALQPDLADALFERAFCHRQLREDELATEDLQRYLRDFGLKVKNPTDPTKKDYSIQKKHLDMETKKNEKALLELLSISLDEFLKTLELPPIPTPHGDSMSFYWLLYTIPVHLIRQRRWEDAIRLLDYSKVKQSVDDARGRHEYAKHLYAFHWAIAHWGKAGEPYRELCLQALRALEPIEADDGGWPPELFHEYSLMYWGVGDAENAAIALDRALDRLDEQGRLLDDVSWWTFQESTPREFRLNCEEMRRMIQGEPIRPAFLGSARANRVGE